MPRLRGQTNVPALSLHGVAHRLRARLRAAGRADLAAAAVAGVRLTDDGTTCYVHVFMREDWPYCRAGDAYPLAFADHPDRCTLHDWRAFLHEANLLLTDDFGRLVRWFDGS